MQFSEEIGESVLEPRRVRSSGVTFPDLTALGTPKNWDTLAFFEYFVIYASYASNFFTA